MIKNLSYLTTNRNRTDGQYDHDRAHGSTNGDTIPSPSTTMRATVKKEKAHPRQERATTNGY
ncbi:MAG: hypothetical protein ORN57_03335 [Alphaproteobacteria bacterium]|nr:hypothetical protein [Alphaproteobacteria bacterium]